MTSLSQAYEPDAQFQVGLRRLYLGTGLFVLGTVLVIAGIVAATTNILVPESGTLVYAREWGGILAGLGVPLFFLGVFTVLPSSRRTRAAAVIGTSVAVLGVALFWHAFPCQWSGSNCGEGLVNLTLPTTLTYFAGTITTFWCLFVGVANFKARNEPGGTATLEVETKGETKIVEVDNSSPPSFGSLGVFGSDPEPEATSHPATSATVSDGGARSREISDAGDDAVVQRSTSSEETSVDRVDDGRSTSRNASRSTTSTGSSGGGTSTARSSGSTRSPRTEDDWTPSGRTRTRSEPSDVPQDQYCGSCRHFQYVRTEGGMQPYCGAHEVLMDDMDACEDWTAR